MQLNLFPSEGWVQKWEVYRVGRIKGRRVQVEPAVYLYARSEAQAIQAGGKLLRFLNPQRIKDCTTIARYFDATSDSDLINSRIVRPVGGRP